MIRGAKADAKPRGRMTAYAYFVQTCREEHKKKHPDETVIFAEFSRKCAERWKVSFILKYLLQNFYHPILVTFPRLEGEEIKNMIDSFEISPIYLKQFVFKHTNE